MLSHSSRAVVLTMTLLLSVLSPLAMPASASDAILLSSDVNHVTLSDGQVQNVTLTIHNNGSSIEDYNVSIDDSGLSAVWQIVASEDVVSNVFPTWSKNTTIIVRLLGGATPSDSGSFDVIVKDSDTNETSSHTIHVSVAPSYQGSLQSAVEMPIMMDQGDVVNLTFNLTNLGTVQDSFLLDVESAPDLAAWWASQQPEPWPEASGNETLLFNAPLDNSTHDVTNGSLPIDVTLGILESEVAYDLELSATNDATGLEVWSYNVSHNGTNSSVDITTSWSTILLGNFTLSGELSSNGTSLLSEDVQVCLYALFGCGYSNNSGGNQSGGNSTGNETGGNSTGNETGGNSTGNGSNTSSITPFGLGGNIPAGWSIFWHDDEYTDVAAQATETATLQVEVPLNAEPDYYGFELFISSINGNSTTSTMLVIEVSEEFDLSLAFLSNSDDFFPGQVVNSTIEVTNTGNGQENYGFTVDSVLGPCDATLLDADDVALESGESINLGFQLDVDESATDASSCDVAVSWAHSTADNSATYGPYTFTVDIDEAVDFALTSEDEISLVPGSPESYEVRIYNNGSEDVTFYLDIEDVDGLDTEFDSLSSVLVAAGDVASWQVSTDADGGVSGIINQGFSVTYAGQTVELSVPINVSAVGDLSITGPMDSRIQLKPSSDVITNFTLTNSGTADLTVVAYLSGLPAGVESEVSDSSIDIPAGGQAEVSLTLLADSTVAAGSYSLTFAYGGEGVSDSLDLDLQVSHRYAVKTSATNSQVVAGPLEWEELSIDVTNLGSTSDTIQLTLDDNGASQWYEFELSSTSLSLTSGEAETVTLRIREKSAGSEDLNISITASSSSDLEVTDTMVIDLAALQSGASITIVSDDDSAKPGDSVYGSVIITNTGNGYDELQLTTPNYNCGVSQVIALEAGASSAAIPWSCDIGGDEIAGLKELPFRVTSQARSTAIYEESEIFTVEEVWDDQLVALVVGGTPVSMPSSGGSSMTVTLTNLANADITGSLSTLGAGEGLFVIEWKRLSDNENTTDYSLGPGQSVDFAIKFNSLVRTQEKAVLKIRATSQVGETTFSDETQDFTVSITGPAMPPSGIALPFGIAIDNTNSIYAVLSGWGLAILLITYIRKRKTVTASEEEETADEADQTEEVEEEEESPLGYNECRMDDGGKISCPSCNSRLGVPRGSEPPFRFTCPSCENKIRVVE